MVSEQQLAELMVAYQGGDLGAFEGVYRALKKPLHQYLGVLTRGRGEADDLLQETFLQIHRSRRTHTPGRPVMPWAFAIARHVHLTHQRKRARLLKRESVASDTLPEIPVPPQAEDLADRESLQGALRQLPPDQAEAITLHHVWGFSFEEIGGTLGIRAVTAKVRAFRGLRRLREILQAGVKPEDAGARSSEQGLL